jgi:hypothetical protein
MRFKGVQSELRSCGENRSLDPDFPIKDKIVLADEDGSTEPQFADRAHEFPHMSRSALADFTRRQLQIVKSNAYEFELRQWVVPPRVRRRRCLRELQELFAPMAAFPLQLTLNSVLVHEEIMTTPGHHPISFQQTVSFAANHNWSPR